MSTEKRGFTVVSVQSGAQSQAKAETADESLVPIRWRPADAVHIPHQWNCNRKNPVEPALDYTQPTAQVRPG
jgi:hypothetical protein